MIPSLLEKGVLNEKVIALGPAREPGTEFTFAWKKYAQRIAETIDRYRAGVTFDRRPHCDPMRILKYGPWKIGENYVGDRARTLCIDAHAIIAILRRFPELQKPADIVELNRDASERMVELIDRACPPERKWIEARPIHYQVLQVGKVNAVIFRRIKKAKQSRIDAVRVRAEYAEYCLHRWPKARWFIAPFEKGPLMLFGGDQQRKLSVKDIHAFIQPLLAPEIPFPHEVS